MVFKRLFFSLAVFASLTTTALTAHATDSLSGGVSVVVVCSDGTMAKVEVTPELIKYALEEGWDWDSIRAALIIKACGMDGGAEIIVP
jgi:hypothetical protein